jgi:hypothetical protein
MPSYIEAFPEPGAEPPGDRREWLAPPADTIAGLVPQAFPLAVTEHVAVVLERVQVFPNGIAFVVRGVVRDFEDGAGLGRFFWEDRGSDQDLTIRVDYADGRSASDHAWSRSRAVDPTSAFLIERGGSGDDRTFERSYWLWPAPPGPVTVSLAWPACAIADASAVITGEALSKARDRIRPIWAESG